MAVAQYHVSIRDITHEFWDGRAALQALRRITLGVPHGQFLSIIGPSGCGKTTLLRIIGGLLRPTAGQALVEARAPAEAQRSRRIGYIFQDPALLPWRNVLGNIRLPLEIDSLKGRELRDPAGLLELVGLDGFGRYYPHQLSGGMQQRVALARALVFNPDLLLMDEPFGALDEITRSGMRYELLRLWDTHSSGAARKTAVFVTHSIAEAVTLSDRVVVLSGRPGTIRADIDIELPRPRTEEMERTPPFLDYVEQLRVLLRERVA